MEAEVRAREAIAFLGSGGKILQIHFQPCCREEQCLVCGPPLFIHSANIYRASTSGQVGLGAWETAGWAGGWPLMLSKVDWVDFSLEGDIEAKT